MHAPGPAVAGEEADDGLKLDSITAGISGRGTRKSSKSAAEKASISPAPLSRYMSLPSPGLPIVIQRRMSASSAPAFCGNRL
jgi:hypothetical protein